jgi:anti-sigma regulatory factor (Ser/Thr protein kinase)
MNRSKQIQINNDLSELERLNLLVEEFGGENNFKTEEEYAIYLCLEEMVTNVISYAWSDGEEHAISIRLSVDEEAIKVEIDDDGAEFNPVEFGKPDTTAPAEERQVGGLGIHLVKQTMDDMFYQRVDERNVLILKKKRIQS